MYYYIFVTTAVFPSTHAHTHTHTHALSHARTHNFTQTYLLLIHVRYVARRNVLVCMCNVDISCIIYSVLWLPNITKRKRYLCLADRKQALPRLAGEDLYTVTTWQRTNFFRPRQRVLLAGRLQGDPRSSHSPPRRRDPGVRQSRPRSGSHHIHGSERQRRLSPETPQRHLAILLCADVQ